jgi:betaine-homocysteine S-methyltransferase
MLPLIESVAKVIKVPLAALPVPYRTTEQEPTFFCLKDDQVKFFLAFSCNRQ